MPSNDDNTTVETPQVQCKKIPSRGQAMIAADNVGPTLQTDYQADVYKRRRLSNDSE